MNITGEVQYTNEANTSGVLLTMDGKLLHFAKPSSIINTLSPGDTVTAECILLSDYATVIAIVVSVP